MIGPISRPPEGDVLVDRRAYRSPRAQDRKRHVPDVSRRDWRDAHAGRGPPRHGLHGPARPRGASGRADRAPREPRPEARQRGLPVAALEMRSVFEDDVTGTAHRALGGLPNVPYVISRERGRAPRRLEPSRRDGRGARPKRTTRGTSRNPSLRNAAESGAVAQRLRNRWSDRDPRLRRGLSGPAAPTGTGRRQVRRRWQARAR
jgi:hypothetical protein